MKRFVTMIAIALSAFFATQADAQYVIKKLTNKSGSAVAAARVVVVDASNASAYTTTTSEDAGKVIGVTTESTNNNAVGGIAILGLTEVYCSGAVSIGDYIGTTTTAGYAASNGSEASGSFAVALEAGTDTNITCFCTGQTGAITSADPSSIALPDGNTTITQGDDNDIRYGYDEAGDDRWEMNDGTNTLFWVKDNGTTGNAGVTGNFYVADDKATIYGTDSDIQITYDEAVDNRLEVTDGTNALFWITDAGTDGNAGPTGDFLIADDNAVRFGTDNDFYITYDETTDNRLEVTDGLGNVLAAISDAGTTGTVTATGSLETPVIGNITTANLVELYDTYFSYNARILTIASASGGAGITLPHGTAPSSPNNGDVWTTTSGLYARINGATSKMPDLASAETITGNWVNTANPWADNEVADDITLATTTNPTITNATPPKITGTNTTTSVSGNAFLRLSGVSSDTDNVTSQEAARIDLAANGNQTQAHPNGSIAMSVASGSGALATVATVNSGGLNVQPNTDSTTTLGRSRFASPNSDQATYSHYDLTSSTDYAIKQNSSGDTYVNAPTGRTVGLRINDTNVVTITGSALTASAPVTNTSSSAWTINSLSVAVPKVAGTWKTRTEYWLSAGEAKATTSNGADEPTVDSSDNFYCEFDTGEYVFWQRVLPADFDGTVDKISVHWYADGASTPSVQWGVSVVVFDDDSTAMSTGYGAASSTTANTTFTDNAEQDESISASSLLGTTSNAGKLFKIRCLCTSSGSFTIKPRLLGIYISI